MIRSSARSTGFSSAVPVMRAQEPVAGWRGQIMVVSSVLARRVTPLGGAYAATKAAQLSLAEALRVELRGQRFDALAHSRDAAAQAEAVGQRPEASRSVPCSSGSVASWARTLAKTGVPPSRRRNGTSVRVVHTTRLPAGRAASTSARVVQLTTQCGPPWASSMRASAAP